MLIQADTDDFLPFSEGLSAHRKPTQLFRLYRPRQRFLSILLNHIFLL